MKKRCGNWRGAAPQRHSQPDQRVKNLSKNRNITILFFTMIVVMLGFGIMGHSFSF